MNNLFLFFTNYYIYPLCWLRLCGTILASSTILTCLFLKSTQEESPIGSRTLFCFVLIKNKINLASDIPFFFVSHGY